MKNEIQREADGTITLTITVPWKDVEEARVKVVDELSKNVSVPGFRKGAAPKKIVAEKLSKERVNEDTLKKVLPTAYVEAVKKNNLNPIIHPQIHVEAFDEGTDLVFNAKTSEEPTVELKNYKDEVKKVTAKSKIILPGKEDPSAISGQGTKVSVDAILDAILVQAEVTVSKLIVDQEVNRLLANTLDELKKLGLTLDQYLASRNKTADELRVEYEEKALKDIKIEFVLRKIADTEKITVEKEDFEKAFASIQDPQQKEDIAKNPYLLASILRQQKTLDFLTKI